MKRYFKARSKSLGKQKIKVKTSQNTEKKVSKTQQLKLETKQNQNSNLKKEEKTQPKPKKIKDEKLEKIELKIYLKTQITHQNMILICINI